VGLGVGVTAPRRPSAVAVTAVVVTVMALGMTPGLIMLLCTRGEAKAEAKVRSLDDYCQFVRAAIREDVDALTFQRGSASYPDQAAERVEAEQSGHSWRDVALCAPGVDDRVRRTSCAMTRQYDCLAKLDAAALATMGDE